MHVGFVGTQNSTAGEGSLSCGIRRRRKFVVAGNPSSQGIRRHTCGIRRRAEFVVVWNSSLYEVRHSVGFNCAWGFTRVSPQKSAVCESIRFIEGVASVVKRALKIVRRSVFRGLLVSGQHVPVRAISGIRRRAFCYARSFNRRSKKGGVYK